MFCIKKFKKESIIILNTVPSTNQYFIDNIRYLKSGDVVVTENQTQGRGRFGKIWITPKGQSICLSIYWKLDQRLVNITKLSLVVSYVVAKVLRNLGVSQIRIKRPNDLYVYNRKLAGILVEVITENRYISHVIIGIGINISISVHTKLRIHMSKNWIDLNDMGIVPNRNMLLSNLIEKLRITLNNFESSQYILKYINY